MAPLNQFLLWHEFDAAKAPLFRQTENTSALYEPVHDLPGNADLPQQAAAESRFQFQSSSDNRLRVVYPPRQRQPDRVDEVKRAEDGIGLHHLRKFGDSILIARLLNGAEAQRHMSLVNQGVEWAQP